MAQVTRVQLFGRPEMVRADGTPAALDSRKSLALLAYLVRQRRPLARASLAALLWADLPEARGRRNLSRELTQLTALLPDSIQADHASVTWSGRAAWVDVAMAAELLQPRPAGTPASSLVEAVALYRGPFMEGFTLDNSAEFESWLLQEREQWQQRITAALEQLITQSVEQGEYGLAQQHTRRWLELEPWQEEAHRTLMLLLARSGQRSAALAQFEACRRALARELDIEPSHELIALAEQIRTGALAPPRPGQATGAAAQAAQPPTTTRDTPGAGAAAQHWSPIPSPGRFYGRAAELAALHELLESRRCRVVAVLGMGGVGKTTLAAQATRALAPGFDAVVWRSLLNAPPLHELLRACLQALAVPPAAIPEQLDDQLDLLLDCMRRRRCLIVLDNVESLLQGGMVAGQYRAGVEGYGQLLQLAGSYEHQSCLLLTSREAPQPLAQLGAATPMVQVLRIGGLDDTACRTLLAAHGVAEMRGTPALVARYSGNPLALALVAELMHELYGGDVDAFLAAEAILFDDIRAVLDQQWARLGALEQSLLLWLAVCRRPQSAAALRAMLAPATPPGAVLDALRSLQRRSLVEAHGAQFSLQNVVLEYATARLIDTVCEEIVHGTWRRFNSHALMQAQTLEYVRESQVRLLLAPLAQQLATIHGHAALRTTLLAGLQQLRTGKTTAPGYAGGNALNVLLFLGADLRGADFSRLCIWQADLRRARLPGVSFAHADLRDTLFAETLRDGFAVAWSPDGELISASVGYGELRLWRTSDWQLLGCCAGPSTFVWHLAFSPAGDRLASCGDDMVVRVWDVATCQALYTLRGHEGPVQTLDWSPDGRLLVTGSRDRTARIWDLQRAAPVHELRGHDERVRWVAWSPDGAIVATASFDRTVRLWDARSGAPCATLAHPVPVHALAWHPDGQQLVTSGEDHQRRVWDVTTGAIVQLLTSTQGLAFQLAYTHDGTRIAGSCVNAVHVWQARSGRIETTLFGHSQSLAGVAWSPDGTLLASRSETSIRVWELASQQTVAVLQGSSRFVHQLALSADERLLATSHMDELVRIWDLASGDVLHTLAGHSNAVLGVSFSRDGETLATAGYDGTVRIWETMRGTLLRTMRTAQTPIVSFARSADGVLLATGCHDGTVWLWDWQCGQARAVLRGHGLPVTAVAFSPDGASLFTSSEERTLCRWDLQLEQVSAELPVEGGCVYALAFDLAGSTLYGGCNDAKLRSWDVATGQLTRRLPAPGAITRLDRSPDGARLVSRGEGIVCVWNAVTGERLLTHRLERSFGPVRFIDDGRAFITSGEDGTLRVWDTQTGALLRALPTPGPYAGLDITGASGLGAVQREGLLALGAVERRDQCSLTA